MIPSAFCLSLGSLCCSAVCVSVCVCTSVYIDGCIDGILTIDRSLGSPTKKHNQCNEILIQNKHDFHFKCKQLFFTAIFISNC